MGLDVERGKKANLNGPMEKRRGEEGGWESASLIYTSVTKTPPGPHLIVHALLPMDLTLNLTEDLQEIFTGPLRQLTMISHIGYLTG